MDILSVKDVSHAYTYGERGLNHISFSLKKGEILAVLGGEKAGKTTLLKILAGLLDYEGEIYFDDKEISKLSPLERNVFLSYRDEGFFENKTVEYNLAYPLKIRGLKQPEIEETLAESAKYFDIGHLFQMKMSSLRPKDRVKTALTRSINRNARLFLYDDPFKGLNIEEKREILLKFASLVKELPMVIFATSDLDEAKTVADKLLLLDYAVCADFGDLNTLINQPLTYTAMNIMEVNRVNTFDGILKKDNDGYFVASAAVNFRFPQSAKLISEEYLGKKVKVAFTPENTKIGKGEIRMLGLYMGRESVGGRIHSIFSVGNARVIAEGDYPGIKYSEALLSVAKDKLKLFDAVSENNIISY